MEILSLKTSNIHLLMSIVIYLFIYFFKKRYKNFVLKLQTINIENAEK